MTKNSDSTRSRRTYREIFLDTLKDVSVDGAPVSNRFLREQLGWDEDRYQQVKDQLVAEAQIAVGRGRGGSVYLIDSEPQNTAKKRRSNDEIFLEKLAELSGGGKTLVTNKELHERLVWAPNRYDRVRQRLLEEGRLVVGPGRVGLPSSGKTEGLTLFISYSHLDDELKVELVKHLEPLQRLKEIATWHDGKIRPGDEWEKEISGHLNKADIVLLLISIDFINSKYCYEKELNSALARHDNGDTTVIPVILRNCLWQSTPFAKLQALPKNGKAVASFTDRDDAFTEVAAGIRQAVEKRLAKK